VSQFHAHEPGVLQEPLLRVIVTFDIVGIAFAGTEPVVHDTVLVLDTQVPSSSWYQLLQFHCAYRFIVLHATSVKLFTDSLFSYHVHNQLAFVFHPLNVALSFVNVFELKFFAVS
jgi:hypothetical protein